MLNIYTENGELHFNGLAKEDREAIVIHLSRVLWAKGDFAGAVQCDMALRQIAAQEG